MAFERFDKYADLNPVSSGSFATADLPNAGAYSAIQLHCKAEGADVSAENIASDIKRIMITLDGETVFDASATFLYDLYEYYFGGRGFTRTDGTLTIWLSPDWLTRKEQSIPLRYGMGNVGVMQITVEFGGSITTDQVEVRALRSAESEQLGTHMRLQRHDRNFASSGDQEISDLSVEQRDDVGTAGIFIQGYDGSTDGAAAVINSVDVIVNSQEALKLTPADLQTLVQYAGRSWPVDDDEDDCFPIPFDIFNNLSGFLPHRGLNDLRLRVNWAEAPNSYKVYMLKYFNIARV